MNKVVPFICLPTLCLGIARTLCQPSPVLFNGASGIPFSRFLARTIEFTFSIHEGGKEWAGIERNKSGEV